MLAQLLALFAASNGRRRCYSTGLAMARRDLAKASSLPATATGLAEERKIKIAQCLGSAAGR